VHEVNALLSLTPSSVIEGKCNQNLLTSKLGRREFGYFLQGALCKLEKLVNEVMGFCVCGVFFVVVVVLRWFFFLTFEIFNIILLQIPLEKRFFYQCLK